MATPKPDPKPAPVSSSSSDAPPPGVPPIDPIATTAGRAALGGAPAVDAERFPGARFVRPPSKASATGPQLPARTLDPTFDPPSPAAAAARARIETGRDVLARLAAAIDQAAAHLRPLLADLDSDRLLAREADRLDFDEEVARAFLESCAAALDSAKPRTGP